MLVILVALASQAARFLVVDEPEKSDAIVVLAGETNVRPARALELLRQGVAPRVFIDVRTPRSDLRSALTDIAQKYVERPPGSKPRLGMPDRRLLDQRRGRRCKPMPATAGRASGADRDLRLSHPPRLVIFRHRLPQYQFSVAAARDPAEFGEAWWTNREWAKTTFDEWSKMLWWEAVDRWR